MQIIKIFLVDPLERGSGADVRFAICRMMMFVLKRGKGQAVYFMSDFF